MSGIFDQIINYSPPLIVSGTVNYKGTWNASTNNPTLNNPPAASTKGDYYVVSTAGTQFSISFAVGDWIISSGTAWEKVDLTDAVSSVFGRTGAVVGVSTDYSAVGLTNTAIGAANPSSGTFTSLSSSSTTTLNGTTVPASKTLVVTTDKLSALASTTSSELAGVISDETGSGALVFGTSPTIATPVIAQINDANGNSTLRLTGITSATDYLEIKNGIGVGSPLHVLAEGASANIGVHLQPKGSGLFTISDGTDFAKGIRFRSSSSAASAVTLIDAVSTAGRVVTLPDATGTLLYGGGPLGTPSSGTVTNLTGTASININGTVGATTPSTGAFTTLSATGDVTASGGNILNTSGGTIPIRVSGATTGSSVARFANTGGDTFFGAEGNATNNLIIGCTAYDTIVRGPSGIAFSANNGTNMQMRLSSTGLAVTGTLSATTSALVNRSGVTAPTSIATNAAQFVGATGESTNLEIDTFAATPFIYGVRRQGTPASPTATQSGNNLLAISGRGYGTTTTSGDGARILFQAAENFTDSANGSRILLQATATGSTSIGTIATVDATGLAVTGALSSTTGANFATSSGNVVIGNATAAAKLHIQADFSGSFGATVRTTSNAADASFIQFVKDAGGSPNAVGSITYTNATNLTNYNSTSDARLKDNVRELTNSGNIIDALRPVLHDWKTGQKNIIGFVAQEVFAVFPQAVSKGDDDLETVTQPWSMDASKLVPILTAELKSLRARVAALESN